MKDPALRACSLAARGLWIDALCLASEAANRGHLEHSNGKPVTSEQLARMVGSTLEEVTRLLAELEEADVFSRTAEGVIFSRRMVRDESKREKCREAGHRGGNPALIGGDKGTLKGQDKGRPKGVKKGAAKGTPKPNPTPSSSSSSSSSSSDLSSPAAPSSGEGGETTTQEPASTRPRNLLFDAVAEVTGYDPSTAGSLLGSVAATLAKADPPYTPAEVREFGRRFTEFCSYAKDNRHRPEPKELQTHIGKLRSAKTQTAPASATAYD